MTTPTRHEAIEARLKEMLDEADLPEPDDVAHLSRAIVFLWYETKAFVLIDLSELPPGADALDGFNIDLLRADILGEPFPLGFPDLPGFADAA
jgi:hypothetical protein